MPGGEASSWPNSGPHAQQDFLMAADDSRPPDQRRSSGIFCGSDAAFGGSGAAAAAASGEGAASVAPRDTQAPVAEASPAGAGPSSSASGAAGAPGELEARPALAQPVRAARPTRAAAARKRVKRQSHSGSDISYHQSTDSDWDSGSEGDTGEQRKKRKVGRGQGGRGCAMQHASECACRGCAAACSPQGQRRGSARCLSTGRHQVTMCRMHHPCMNHSPCFA
jgi:hypothetical protein